MIKKYCIQSLLLSKFPPVVLFGSASVLSGRKPKLEFNSTLYITPLSSGLQLVPPFQSRAWNVLRQKSHLVNTFFILCNKCNGLKFSLSYDFELSCTIFLRIALCKKILSYSKSQGIIGPVIEKKIVQVTITLVYKFRIFFYRAFSIKVWKI